MTPSPEVEPVDDVGRAQEIERLDIARLGAMLRERRGNLSLRKAAEAANVSFSTFSRVEAGSQPDLTSFTLLCAWLGVPPSEFFTPVNTREVNPIDEAISHLVGDPRLNQEAVSKISTMLKDMYEFLATSEQPEPLVACHLRAASVMRPGVSARLSSLLSDMHTALASQVADDRL